MYDRSPRNVGRCGPCGYGNRDVSDDWTKAMGLMCENIAGDQGVLIEKTSFDFTTTEMGKEKQQSIISMTSRVYIRALPGSGSGQAIAYSVPLNVLA